MASILTHAIISEASGAVDSYIAAAQNLYSTLESTIHNLTGENFVGDASNGYVAFFNATVKPALTENLTEANSLMVGIKSMLNSIQEQLLDTLDPQLGQYNETAGS